MQATGHTLKRPHLWSHVRCSSPVVYSSTFLSRCPDKPNDKVKLRLHTLHTRLPARVLQEAGSGKGLGTQGTD